MRAWADRLAPVDEANLVLDHAGQVNVFLVAGLLAPGGFVDADGRADLDELRVALRARILQLPALCRVISRRGRRRVWLAAEPDLARHVRVTREVEGVAGLEALCARLMITPLDLTRPLWEILIVPGASASGPAVVVRIHHAIADGMTAATIVSGLFDPPPGADAPQEAPLAAHPAHRHPARLGYALRRIGATLGGREVGQTILLGRRSDDRGVVFLDADLDALRARARREGVTVNDCLLAAAAAGYRTAMTAACEPPPDRLPVSVPVALPRRGTARNQVGVMLVRLPLATDGPDERLRLIAAQTRTEKAAARDQGTLEFMRGPVGARLMDWVGGRQHLVGGFVTNVRGPRGVPYLAGSLVHPVWPVAVIAADVRLGVAALSVGGRLGCGIHFDAVHVPGDAFARGMRAELDRLTS